MDNNIIYNYALLKASEVGDISTVRVLLDDGKVNVDVQDDQGTTALITATEQGHLEVVNLLIQSGANVNLKGSTFGQTALMKASENGDLEMVKFLLEEGKVDTNLQDNNGKTALMKASKECYLEMMKLLIENGANVGIEDNDGNTALLYVLLNFSNRNKLETVKYLVEKGNANIYHRNKKNESAFMIASRRGYVYMENFLSQFQS